MVPLIFPKMLCQIWDILHQEVQQLYVLHTINES